MKIKLVNRVSIAACLLILLLTGYVSNNVNYDYILFNNLLNVFKLKQVCIVTNKNNFLDNAYIKSLNVVNSSGKIFVYTDNLLNNKIISDSNYVEFNLNSEASDLLTYLYKFGAKIVYKENIAKREVFYLFVPMLSKYKVVNGEKVNIQLIIYEKNCLIGYPMIYTAY